MRIAAVLVAAALVAPQEDEEQSVQEEIAALIEKTNALETFHLIYDLKGKDEDGPIDGTMELVYRAPDLGRLRFSGSHGDIDNWIVGEHVYFQQDGDWKSALAEPAHVKRVLFDLFPGAAKPLEAGVAVSLSLRLDDSGKGDFSLVFGKHSNGRSCLLGWLQNLQRLDGVLAEDSSLRWERDGILYLVSRATGLLEEAALTSEKGSCSLRLRESHLDVEQDSELTTLPAAALSAPEDPELTRSFASNASSLRRDAFLQVAYVLDLGSRTWGEPARNDWREVMDALHR